MMRAPDATDSVVTPDLPCLAGGRVAICPGPIPSSLHRRLLEENLFERARASLQVGDTGAGLDRGVAHGVVGRLVAQAQRQFGACAFDLAAALPQRLHERRARLKQMDGE